MPPLLLHRLPFSCSWPQQKLALLSNPQLFEKLDPEALFFSFYYQPGSFQQYLAARELKRQCWRYHKHHSAWFQVLPTCRQAQGRNRNRTLTYKSYQLGSQSMAHSPRCMPVGWKVKPWPSLWSLFISLRHDE